MRRFALDLAVVAALLWLGFVLAISFFEAPLKFQAGVPKVQTLAIGRVVFLALNRVEWILALTCAATLLARPPACVARLLGLAAGILAVQTWALLPPLDARLQAMLAGEQVPASSLHVSYVILEVAKVFALLAMAWVQLRARPLPAD